MCEDEGDVDAFADWSDDGGDDAPAQEEPEPEAVVEEKVEKKVEAQEEESVAVDSGDRVFVSPNA